MTQTAEFKWAILSDVLTTKRFFELQQRLRSKTHMKVDVNELGPRWRRALDETELKWILSDEVKVRIAKALGYRERDIRALVPRYWDSVFRESSQELEPHNDLIPEDRRIACAFYLNRRWEEQWGGHLNLHFGDLVVPIPPTPNTMIVFEVNMHSWHSVGNVTHGMRHAAVGWLNGKIPCDPLYRSPTPDPANTRITIPDGEMVRLVPASLKGIDW